MTPLRKRMMEELPLRTLSPITADTYIQAVERFARYFNPSPARLGSEQVREYLVHLIQDKKVVANTLLVQRAALKFLYVAILRYPDHGPVSTRVPAATAGYSQSLRCAPAEAYRPLPAGRPTAVMEPRLEVAEVFRQHQQEFLARWGDTLSSPQRQAFRDIGACRTAALGARLPQCDHCSHQDLVFPSCRHRAGPQCPSGAREKWLATTAQRWPVPYSHVTFTLPHQLCRWALQNPRRVYGMLFQAASQTLLTPAADPRRIGAQIGFLAVLHTWDQQMRPNPHS